MYLLSHNSGSVPMDPDGLFGILFIAFSCRQQTFQTTGPPTALRNHPDPVQLQGAYRASLVSREGLELAPPEIGQCHIDYQTALQAFVNSQIPFKST